MGGMSLLDRRVRGFRLVDVVALGLLTMLILGVYLAKTVAGRERAEIARIERQIIGEKARIRLLTAEVSHLEQPARIERLSTAYLGLAPVSVKRETTPDGLIEAARHGAAVSAPALQAATPRVMQVTAAPDPAAAEPAAR
jgi:hypothetical protein